MSAFKEMIDADIKGVFINLDEFAEIHKWNSGTGKSYEIHAVLDDDILIRKYSAQYEFLGQDSHMLFASAADFVKKPKISDAVRLDGVLYTVDRIEEDMGMYTIFLIKGMG